MLALAELSREDDWYAPLSQELSVNSRYLLALEAEASLLSVFEQGAVPALLQTDRYARAVTASLNPGGQTWRARRQPQLARRPRDQGAGPQAGPAQAP